MSRHTADVLPITTARCKPGCPFRGATREHHRWLLEVDWEHERLVGRMEVGGTWCDVGYVEQAGIPPERWLDFGAAHRWRESDQAERVLLMATDVALRVRRPAQRLSVAGRPSLS